jgi:hypothetical protein
MTIQAVIELLQIINRTLQNLWIERQSLGARLLRDGYTQEQLNQIIEAAKSNPQYRAQAERQFAEMREGLERAAREASMDAMSEMPPPGGQPS